jgi:hypothetical protein
LSDWSPSVVIKTLLQRVLKQYWDKLTGRITPQLAGCILW